MSNTLKIIGLVVVAGVVSFVLRGLYVAASKPGPVAPPVQVRVRAAVADLPQGLLLRDTDLTWKTVAREAMPVGAVVENTPADAELHGAVLRHDMARDSVIVPADVLLANAPGFLAATLKPDMRAVSVAIDDVSGNAGLIQPGDYVDLLLTQDMARRTEAPDLAVASEIVVQQARVLAVGSELKRPKDDAANNSANTRARTVTLEVTPRTAGVVAVAARLGSLSLALRSFAIRDRSSAVRTETAVGVPPMPGVTAVRAASADVPPLAPPVWAGDISRAVRALPAERHRADPTTGAPAPARKAAGVIVYRGSDKTDPNNETQMASVPPLPPGSSLPATPAVPSTSSLNVARPQ